MGTTIKIQDVDLGWRKTQRNLAGLDRMRVSAGLLEPEQAFKGAIHELGSKSQRANGEPYVKPRPWLSIAADQNESLLAEEAKDDIGAVADCFATPRQALSLIGRLMKKSAKAVIETRQVGGDPLAQSTIDRKGHDQKLVDSGDMLKAIDFEIGTDGDDI